MGTGFTITMLGFFATMAVIVIAATVSEIKTKGRKKDAASEPPPPPPFTSLSLLAGLSFFSGVGAILLATIAGILSLSLSMGEVIPMTDSTRRQVELAARIVLYSGLLPAVGAAAFGLAARGVISESRGAVRGRPLYRTGLLLAVITAVVVFNAKILNPASWLESTDEEAVAAPSEVERGFLGIEYGPMEQDGVVSLIRVVPGSPADRAGLKAGDVVTAIDGRAVSHLDPSSGGGYSPGKPAPFVGQYIGSLKPGSRVTVSIRRVGKTQEIVAELAASFESLLRLVKKQSHDDERIAVLKAAGAQRRYSADELRRICATFDFDDDRLKVIESSLPLLQDPQNAYQVLGALDHGDSKQQVSGWIEKLMKPK